jgi:hypothetical protein
VSYHIYIDRTTGTWGLERDLVIAEVKESTIDNMETMSNSQLIKLASELEEINK